MLYFYNKHRTENNMENKEYKFALMIDTENVSSKYYELIINELDEMGSVKIKRAYGDFSSGNQWKEKAINEGVTPMQAFAQTKGKNSTDMVMVIDAMDIFYNKEVDAFCIATSDSDFARLAQRLKEGGMYVVIAGEEKTPASLSRSCDKFLMLNELYKNMKDEKETENVSSANKIVTMPKLKLIRSTVKQIMENNMDSNGWTYYSTVVDNLTKKFPQFNHKAYQAKSKQDFFKERLDCEFWQENTIVRIRMKK